MTVENATPLNMIELLLKTIPIGPPSKHKNSDDTQATHQTRQAHNTSSTLYVFLQYGGHPKGRLEMIKDNRTFE
jgi:hypothetical protein